VSDKTPTQVCSEGLSKFSINPYMRLINAAYHATLDASGNPNLRPRHVVIRLVGAPGVGKTAIVEDYCRKAGIGYLKLDTQKTDVAEIFGLSTVSDSADGGKETVVAVPKDWPKEGTTGILNIDDMSRALPHIQQALQQFSLERTFAGVSIPNTWAIVITDNPDTVEYNVSQLDRAQLSRFLSVPYNVAIDVELEQMEIQDVHEDLKNFWLANRDGLKTERVSITKPDSNPRMRMIFARIYPYIKDDRTLLSLIATCTFGVEFLATFDAWKSTEKPISPEVILAGEDVEDKIDSWVSQGMNSLLAITVHRLYLYLKNMKSISKDQFSSVSAFLCLVPPEMGSKLVVSMVDYRTDFGKRFQPLVLSSSRLLGLYKEKLTKVKAEME